MGWRRPKVAAGILLWALLLQIAATHYLTDKEIKLINFPSHPSLYLRAEAPVSGNYDTVFEKIRRLQTQRLLQRKGITLTSEDIQKAPAISVILQILNSPTVANASVAMFQTFATMTLGEFICHWMLEPISEVLSIRQLAQTVCVGEQVAASVQGGNRKDPATAFAPTTVL